MKLFSLSLCSSGLTYGIRTFLTRQKCLIAYKSSDGRVFSLCAQRALIAVSFLPTFCISSTPPIQSAASRKISSPALPSLSFFSQYLSFNHSFPSFITSAPLRSSMPLFSQITFFALILRFLHLIISFFALDRLCHLCFTFSIFSVCFHHQNIFLV